MSTDIEPWDQHLIRKITERVRLFIDNFHLIAVTFTTV